MSGQARDVSVRRPCSGWLLQGEGCLTSRSLNLGTSVLVLWPVTPCRGEQSRRHGHGCGHGYRARCVLPSPTQSGPCRRSAWALWVGLWVGQPSGSAHAVYGYTTLAPRFGQIRLERRSACARQSPFAPIKVPSRHASYGLSLTHIRSCACGMCRAHDTFRALTPSSNSASSTSARSGTRGGGSYSRVLTAQPPR